MSGSTRPIEQAEDTPVMFTAEHWRQLQSIPTELKAIAELLKNSIAAQEKVTAGIRASIVASDERCEASIKRNDARIDAANQRVDDAHARISRHDRKLARWAGYGAAAVMFISAFGWYLTYMKK